MLNWIEHLRQSEVTGTCDEMLLGIRPASVEIAGCISLGLVRPAIFAMRGQIDLALAWLFYKDHRVEWNHVLDVGEGFKLKGEIFEFLTRYRDKFSERMNLLDRYKTRKIADPYRLLSAHIHNQSTLVMPKFTKLEAMVYSHSRCLEAIKIQSEVSEYIGDIFLSYFGSKWASLPDQILVSVKKRVPTDKQPILFA